MIDLNDDLTAMFSTDDFGQTFTHSSGSFVGIFDEPMEDIDAGGGVPFLLTQPRITAKTIDLTGVTVGTTLTSGGNSYKVRVVLPDGTGVTVLAVESV